MRCCGALARLIVVECEGELVGGIIFFEHDDRIFLWSAGMVYDRSSFSPYTLCLASAFRHAFARGFKRLEAGRLNERIKRRLGLTPSPLYSLIARDLLPAALDARSGLSPSSDLDPAYPALH